MSLLYDILKEMAADGSTGAGDVANARGSLFGGGAVDIEKENRRKTRMLRRIGYVPVKDILKLNQSNTWAAIKESEDTSFDTADVVSKLDAAEQRAKADTDTVTFGMEDDDGKIIKVSVRAEQADEFEQTLAMMLAGADDDDNNENTSTEIAEVLFNLKDKFQIINVEWPTIEGDEEEEQEIEGDDSELQDDDSELQDDEMGPDDGEMVDDTEDDAKSALASVIDMMKADAEAKKAEAEAKTAAAEAEISKHAAAAAESKVSQEEQILDMEAHEKAKADAAKEAKTLAKLAKYRHETKTSDTADVSGSDFDVAAENEETSDQGEYETISKEDLAALLLKHMTSN